MGCGGGGVGVWVGCGAVWVNAGRMKAGLGGGGGWLDCVGSGGGGRTMVANRNHGREGGGCWPDIMNERN